jgi:hypothetical protein
VEEEELQIECEVDEEEKEVFARVPLLACPPVSKTTVATTTTTPRLCRYSNVIKMLIKY